MITVKKDARYCEDAELFRKAYEECQAEDIENIDIASFIKRCEETYKMTTHDFRTHFEENEREGNVEMHLWYQFSSSEYR